MISDRLRKARLMAELTQNGAGCDRKVESESVMEIKTFSYGGSTVFCFERDEFLYSILSIFSENYNVNSINCIVIVKDVLNDECHFWEDRMI